MSNDDVLRLIADKKWRMSHLYYIVNAHGEKVIFKRNHEQAQLADARKKHKKHIILKARQIGFTTDIVLDMFDEILSNSNKHARIITHGLKESEKIMLGKIHFAYDNLPQKIKEYLPVIKRNTEEFVIGHTGGKSPSSISVGTSGRSGTFQMLHISEFGKICAKYPEKAREIITGALPAAENGQIFIESTAEGQAGRFYEITMEALSNQRQLKPLNPKDYQFHFYDWHNHDGYSQTEPEIISNEQSLYFEKLRTEHKINLTEQQKYWYIATEKQLQNDMKREYPSYPEEAFEQAVEGAVYGRQFIELDKEQRILDIAHDAMSPVFTSWDIGNSDTTAIWFYQIKHGGWIDFIDYYEMNKADANHYVSLVHGKNYRYGKHRLPHDANREGVAFSAITSQKLLADAGLRDIFIIPRTENILDDISFIRTRFAQVRFNKNNPMVMEGVKKLRNYQFAWNEKFGRWSDTPIHNDASHCADAFRNAIVSLPKDIATLVTFKPAITRPNKPVNNKKRFV
jgi:hypothetical protein